MYRGIWRSPVADTNKVCSGQWGGDRLPPRLRSAWLPHQTTQVTSVVDDISTSSGRSLACRYFSTLPMAKRATPVYFAERLYQVQALGPRLARLWLPTIQICLLVGLIHMVGRSKP